MICPRCGHKTFFDIVDCSRCGWQAPSSMAAAAPPPEAAPPPGPADPMHRVESREGAGSGDVTVGVLMLLGGLVLTGASLSASSSGGHSVIFTGLIGVGIWRIVRGLSQS